MINQKRQDDLAEHVKEVNARMLTITALLEEAIECETSAPAGETAYKLDNALFVAQRFRQEVIDLHPSSRAFSTVKFPYDMLIAKEFFEALNKAQELAPAVIPNSYLIRHKLQEAANE